MRGLCVSPSIVLLQGLGLGKSGCWASAEPVPGGGHTKVSGIFSLSKVHRSRSNWISVMLGSSMSPPLSSTLMNHVFRSRDRHRM